MPNTISEDTRKMIRKNLTWPEGVAIMPGIFVNPSKICNMTFKKTKKVPKPTKVEFYEVEEKINIFDLWAENWKNARRFFKSMGNAQTKSRLKTAWYKSFEKIFTEQIELKFQQALQSQHKKDIEEFREMVENQRVRPRWNKEDKESYAEFQQGYFAFQETLLNQLKDKK